jgi:NDP-sugar pyrophosphorylase family protein
MLRRFAPALTVFGSYNKRFAPQTSDMPKPLGEIGNNGMVEKMEHEEVREKVKDWLRERGYRPVIKNGAKGVVM